MCRGTVNLSLKDLLALDAAAAGVHCGAHHKESDLAVFVRDDLRLRFAVGDYIRQLDLPSAFLKLAANYLYPKGMNVSLGHQFSVCH